jgi:uncharacterized membrane protein
MERFISPLVYMFYFAASLVFLLRAFRFPKAKHFLIKNLSIGLNLTAFDSLFASNGTFLTSNHSLIIIFAIYNYMRIHYICVYSVRSAD